MKKTLKALLVLLIVGLFVIQFFKPKKNIASGTTSNAIGNHYHVSPEVQTILTKACNDCHSNNTKYPWYNNIQPVAWWLHKHVVDGIRHLNFDEFASYSVAKQYKRMNDCIDEIKEAGMPLPSYTWTHKDAILTEPEKQILHDWCNAVRDSIKNKYPADSLIIKNKKQG